MQRLLWIFRALPAVLLLSGLLLGTTVRVTRAQNTCDQPVIDAAGVFGDEIDGVEAAANELSQRGAQVRVRTVSSYAPAGNLDDYMRELEQRCATWRATDGERQPDLVVVLLALQERSTGIYYGTQWKAALDDNWSQIQADEINPRFREGDFAGGFIAGLQAMDEARAAAADSSAGDTAVAPGDGGAGLGYCAGMFALVAGLIGGGFGLRRRRKAQQLLKAAQQQTAEAKNSVVTLIVGLPKQLEDLQLRIKLLATQIAADEATPLATGLSAVQQAHQHALLAFDTISQSENGQRKLSVAEYEALAQQYREVQPLAEQVAATAGDLLAQIERIDQAIQFVPDALSQTHTQIAHAHTELDAIEAMGFRVEAQRALLAQALTTLSEAEAAAQQRRFLQASELIAQSVELTAAAVEQAQALPTTSEQLRADLERLVTRSTAAAALISDGHQTMSAISSIYNPASWAAVKPNGPEAERLHATGQQQIAAARAAATMERQDWTTARAEVSAADATLEQVETLIGAITALQTRLERAQIEAPALIAAAHQERATIESELRQYSDDVPDQVWQQLRVAADDLAAAERVQRESQPNYLELVDLIERARTGAQQALEAARAAHQAAEEERQRVAAALQQAKDTISDTESRINMSGSDVSRAATRDLRQAKQHLDRAEQSADLATRLEHATKAQAEAQAAYSRAQRDVAEAEEERRAAAAAVAMASSSSHHSSSSDSSDSSGSSGSSSSWSSSGGSSSSWGDSGGSSSSSSDSGGSSSSSGGGGSSSW